MVKTLRFEKLQERHIPAILEIEPLANTCPWSEQSFKNELTNTQTDFLVAIGDGQVIGYAGGWDVVDEFHVTTVAVHPDLRRQGVGLRLVVRLLEAAQERGMECSTLEVRASNEPAILLYEKLGFVRAGLRKRYYPDNKEDATIMWLHDLKDWQAPRL